MMGARQVAQGALFYEFSIEDCVPGDHPMRAIERFVDLTVELSGWPRIGKNPPRQLKPESTLPIYD